ncbi:MAG: hypothetical protein ACI867_001860 [Glaciecola sp.]|jgi:hypothetical protein
MRGARLAIVAALLAAQACSGLQFVDHDEVVFTFPPDRSTVALPVLIEWDAKEIATGQGFAVFIDRSPQPPGMTIDEAFDLDDRGGIVLSDRPELVLEQLAIRGGVPERDRDRHELTVVILDGEGRRVGEFADVLELLVDRSRRD